MLDKGHRRQNLDAPRTSIDYPVANRLYRLPFRGEYRTIHTKLSYIEDGAAGVD
jgi:hypothetical protein